MEDHIERADAIKAVRESRAWHFNEIVPVLSAIKGIPSAEKQGEWIEEIYIDGHTYGTCSNCLHIRIQDNYCPNCGARMKEVDNE